MDFFAEYQKLIKSQPRVFTHSLRNENCDWGDYVYHSKNCYMCFDDANCEDCFYVYNSYKCVDCMDCDYCVESELCYECHDGYKCYNSTYLDNCERMQDSHFCINCKDLSHCFGCVGLHHNKYCIFNKQYTKSEYFKKVEEFKKLLPEENLKRLKALSDKYPRQRVHAVKSEDVPYGNFVTNCADSYWMFDDIGCQDCGYLYQSKFSKDCFDLHQAYTNELCYEGHTAMSYNCSHTEQCSYLSSCHFMFNCNKCENCWGCVNLNNNKYCILNRQYSKKEYFKKVAEIRKELGWPPEPRQAS